MSVDTPDSGAEDVEEHLVSGYTGRLLWVTAIGAMVATLGQFVFPLLLPTIIEELAISPSRAGFLITVIWLLMAVGRYPGGRLADQLSRKTVLVGAILLAITGLAIFAASIGYWTLVSGAVVLGFGLGLYFPAALAQISDLFVEKRGQAMGIHIGSVNIGGAVASGLVFVVLLVAPWRGTFLPLIAVLFVIGVLMHFWNAQPYVLDRDAVDLDLFATAYRLVRTPGMPWVIALLGLFQIIFNGFVNFLPTFLQVEKGIGSQTTSIVFASFFVIGALANPVAGRLGDRFHHPLVAASSSALTAFGLVWIIVADTVPLVAVGVLVIGAGGTAIWPVMTAYIMDLLPGESMGGDFGALSTIYFLIGSTGPTYVGVVAENADYTVAYTTLVGGLVVSVAIALVLARKY